MLGVTAQRALAESLLYPTRPQQGADGETPSLSAVLEEAKYESEVTTAVSSVWASAPADPAAAPSLGPRSE